MTTAAQHPGDARPSQLIHPSSIRVRTLPTVYRPQGDTALLIEALEREQIEWHTRVLDVCTGSGAVALAAARLGSGDVTAVDLSPLAVATTWLNARLQQRPVSVRRGSLFDAVRGRQFDLLTANPPYVPITDTSTRPRGRAVCWDAGPDGRAVLDRICREAPAALSADGRLLIVHSALSGPDETLAQLTRAGLDATVIAERTQPFGPVLTARAAEYEARGLIAPGQRHERLVVIRGKRPSGEC